MRCCYCRCPVSEYGDDGEMAATIEHVIPLGRGGTNHRSNKRIACKRCNNEKGDLLPGEYLEFKKRIAAVPRFRQAAAKQIRAEIVARRQA